MYLYKLCLTVYIFIINVKVIHVICQQHACLCKKSGLMHHNRLSALLDKSVRKKERVYLYRRTAYSKPLKKNTNKNALN